MSGPRVAEECIADNGGYYLSYHTYKNAVARDEESVLPGFNIYSPQQMFWITYATSWCEKYKLNEIGKLSFDPHPVGYLRVFGGLKNSEEFSKDFQCTKNSPMNPENKCRYWDL